MSKLDAYGRQVNPRLTLVLGGWVPSEGKEGAPDWGEPGSHLKKGLQKPENQLVLTGML